VNSPHRWRLQFELRGNAAAVPGIGVGGGSADAAHSLTISETALEPALAGIRSTFSNLPDTQMHDPATLVGDLEAILDRKRESWPLAACRTLGDALLAGAEGRKISGKHEARWLNLLGYCLRPGFGDAADASRMTQARRIYQAGLAFPESQQNQVDWLVLWRRIAGGLSAAQQNELRNYLGGIGVGRAKKGPRLNPQVEREGWRVLASLEHLSGATRAALGSELLRKLKKDPAETSWLWSLGRFGVRIPLYGALTCVVPNETAEEWIMAILDAPEITSETASAIVQMARLTGDRSRDLSETIREHAMSKLRSVADDELLAPLKALVLPSRGDISRTVGEPLPRGLNLESTTDCLSPVSAITTG